VRPLDKLRALVRQLTPGGDTSERVVKSAIWLLGQNAVGRLIQLSMLIILAQLIGPREIGLMGIALLGLNAMKRFTDIGLNAALIQQKDDDVDSYLNTVWILEIGRGALIALVLVAAAPFVASLFDTPRATDLLRAVALSPLIIGLKNPGVVYFQKNLEFHKQFVYRMGGEIAQFFVAVGWALVWPTAWAFVAGFLAADVVRLAASYFIHGYRPWPEFDRSAAFELVDYGKYITGTAILYFLYSEGDDAFVGWMLSPVALGFYQYGYRFSNAPATEISQVVSGVMFPAFSKLQEDTALLRDAFLKTVRLTSFLAFPMAAGIAVVAPSFVRAFLGSEWTPTVLAMQILAVYGLLRAIGKTFSPVWKAIGRPDYAMKLSLLRVVLVALFIYPATARYGIAGTAAVVTGVYVFPMMPLDLYLIVHSVETTYARLAHEFLYPAVASLVMAAGVWYLHLAVELEPILEFGLLVVVGVVLYTVAALLLELRFDWGIRQNFETILASVRS
jgi:PST family polysaccharide transporter/lipopolysaccharide exporter